MQAVVPSANAPLPYYVILKWTFLSNYYFIRSHDWLDLRCQWPHSLDYLFPGDLFYCDLAAAGLDICGRLNPKQWKFVT